MSDHSFIKEVIKEKPLNKKAVLIKLVCLLGAAVLFGAAAAYTFAHVLPSAQESVEAKKEPSKIDIPADEVEVIEKEEENLQLNSETITPEVVEVPQELGLEDYKKFYSDMKAVSADAKRATVNVIGITNEMDYLNNEYEKTGQLSGFIVGNNGKELLILTEYRVVDQVERIQVTFCNKTIVDAHFQKQDRNTGLAIIKVPLETIDEETKEAVLEAPLGNSYGILQGEPVIALGSPMGYGDSIAFGVVTSVTNEVSTLDTEYSLLTTDILGSKEGSGILVNLEGKIVGVILQNYSTENNTVTALSVSQIKQLIETLSNNGQLPYMGIKGQNVTTDSAQKLGIPQGIYVDEVEPDSPAMQAGIRNSDIVTQIGKKKISTFAEYRKELEKCEIDQPVEITIMRKGVEGYSEITIDVIVRAL